MQVQTHHIQRISPGVVHFGDGPKYSIITFQQISKPAWERACCWIDAHIAFAMGGDDIRTRQPWEQ